MRKLFKCSLHRGKLNEETIWNFQAFMNSKKNSCRGNYMRKCGIRYSLKSSLCFRYKRMSNFCCTKCSIISWDTLNATIPIASFWKVGQSCTWWTWKLKLKSSIVSTFCFKRKTNYSWKKQSLIFVIVLFQI